jgi:hypothetical protein
MITLKFHTDPGHGWLEVPAPILDACGLTFKDFTTCSYVSSLGTMYLEEDCDALKFKGVFESKFGPFEVREVVYHRGHAPLKRLPPNTFGEWKPFAA